MADKPDDPRITDAAWGRTPQAVKDLVANLTRDLASSQKECDGLHRAAGFAEDEPNYRLYLCPLDPSRPIRLEPRGRGEYPHFDFVAKGDGVEVMGSEAFAIELQSSNVFRIRTARPLPAPRRKGARK